MRKWWQDIIIYQVYLRSFQDGNGDGIGDLPGLISRLDHIKTLGADTVWVSPHYDSPMDDNGYDIRDFHKVSPDYGSLDDFRRLVAEAHKRGMKIIIDMVLNHTSDEHPWFQAAKDPTHPEHGHFRDFYIWQEPKWEKGERKRPTNWTGFFGNPTWTYNELMDEYYLHIFSKKMPDLNWRNKAVRKAMKKVLRFWIDIGVDGFRLDAANHLEKNWDFPDASPGYEHFSSLPKHHEYLQELGEEIFEPHDLVIIGESGGASTKEALQYAGFDSEEFDMLIHFGHCWADTDSKNTLTPGKWAKGEIDVPKIKKSFARWHEALQGKGWNAIYWHNHDHPRIVSHYGDDARYWKESAKMLALTLYLLPGTPIVYYGEEIGMTNVDYERLEDFRDVEVFTEYENFRANGSSHEVAMQALRDRSRDNARSPMQWNGDKHAGFSQTTPWMPVNKNHVHINVKDQLEKEESLLKVYQRLLSERRKEDVAHGDVTFFGLEHPETFNYLLRAKTCDYLVLANFKETPLEMEFPIDPSGFRLFLYTSDRKRAEKKATSFGPYEARMYKRKR